MVTLFNPALAPNLSFTRDRNWHLARRATMVSSRAVVTDIRTLGSAAWLDRQLAPGTIDDSYCENEIARVFPDANLPTFDFYTKYPWRGAYAYAPALARQRYFMQQVLSKRQLQMAAADFWVDHLSISVGKTPTTSCRYYEIVVNNALGKFSELLKQVYFDLNMNVYLDNITNRKASPNQNLARELLELHTLGVGNYTQSDIVAVSRAISGANAITKPDSNGANRYVGGIYYSLPVHDTSPVSCSFGWSHPNSPKSNEEINGVVISLLDFLARHPATAKRICTRLVTRFISDEPQPQLVSELTKIYLANDTDIRPVLKRLFTSTVFGASSGKKIARPQHQMVRMMSACLVKMGGSIPTQIDVEIPLYKDGVVVGKEQVKAPQNQICQGVLYHAERSGHGVGMHLFPDGYDLSNSSWLTTGSLDMQWRATEVMFFIRGRQAGYNYIEIPDLLSAFGIPAGSTYTTAIRRMFTRITGHAIDSTTMNLIAQAWAGTTTTPNLSSPAPANRVLYALQAIFASPYFQII